MAHLPVQCQNCGARYKIPETFKSDSAKCKACGTVIDVAAAREALPDDAPAKSAGKAAAKAAGASATAKSAGGTRRPRQVKSASKSSGRSRRSHDDDDEPETKKKIRGSSRRTAGASSRRSRRGDDDDDDHEEGHHHYEKPKDKTPLIMAVVSVALVVVAIVAWQVIGKDDEENANKPNEKAANAKTEEGGAKKAADGDAEKGSAEVKDAVLNKGDKDPDGEEDGSAKKKDPKKKKPAKKPAQPVKKPEEIASAADVYKPSSELEKFEQPAAMNDEDVDEVNSLLDDLKVGSGLAAIRAPKNLEAKGIMMIPVAVNRLIELDYSKPEDTQYAFQIVETIRRITNFEFGFAPVRSPDEFKFAEGHHNATRVKNVHQMTKIYWQSEDGWKKYKKKYTEKFR